MTDQEINEAVARKLKGWFSNCKCKIPIETAHHNCPGEFGVCHYPDNCNLPDYCHSIEAAWEILEAWHGDWKLNRYNNKAFECVLYRPSEEFSELADTAPMAICVAFLKLP